MTDPDFFAQKRSLAVADVVALVKAGGEGAFAGRRITDIAALDRAGPADIAYAAAPGDEALLKRTRAGVCLVTKELAAVVPDGVVGLVVGDPYDAFVKVAAALFPDASRPSSLFDANGRAPNATIHPSARLEPGVTIDPAAVIGPRAEIGSGTLIGAMAVVGPDVRVGRDCRIGPGACVTHALVGDRVTIHAGARLGDSAVNHTASKLTAAGRVIVQDGVEIGANSTVARGAIGDTVIGEGARIDNLANIPSDVMVDRHCVIMGVAASLPGPAR
jgi:UDP-3-O-[3-hydroxymyristoyl] glucosamine N-acyltransferase